jgi:predicted metal-dependent hydrolase
VRDLEPILQRVVDVIGEPLPTIRVTWAEPGHQLGTDWAQCLLRPVGGERWIAISTRAKRAPLYVLTYLVLHEVLHIACPPRGRCKHHKAFRVAERLWPDYCRANRWLWARSG